MQVTQKLLDLIHWLIYLIRINTINAWIAPPMVLSRSFRTFQYYTSSNFEVRKLKNSLSISCTKESPPDDVGNSLSYKQVNIPSNHSTCYASTTNNHRPPAPRVQITKRKNRASLAFPWVKIPRACFHGFHLGGPRWISGQVLSWWHCLLPSQLFNYFITAGGWLEVAGGGIQTNQDAYLPPPGGAQLSRKRMRCFTFAGCCGRQLSAVGALRLVLVPNKLFSALKNASLLACAALFQVCTQLLFYCLRGSNRRKHLVYFITTKLGR